jgi:hypothetical protein
MRTLPIVLALLLTPAAPHAASLETPTDEGRKPLPNALCLDPRRGIDWDRVDERHLIVASVGRYYLIGLRDLCPELGFTTGILLSAGGAGRICGNAGEYVIANRARCPIRWVERLDEDLYMEYRNKQRQP